MDLEGVMDSFDVGHVVFVFRYSQLPESEKACSDLSKILPVERAKLHGRPGLGTRALINQQWGRPQSDQLHLDVREVCAINCGDAGYVWKVTWHYSLSGGSSGPPLEYRAYVNPDGSLISPKRLLCDQMRLFDIDQHIFSVLSFEDLVKKKDNDLVHGDEVLALAKSELGAFIKESFAEEKTPEFRFYDQAIVNVAIDTDRNATVVNAKVWAVNFIKADCPDEEIHETERFTVWVTTDGLVSQLSLPGWQPTDRRADE